MEQDLAAQNKQAIAAAKQYMGHFAPLTVVLVVAVLVVFVGNIWLATLGLVPLWAAFLIYAAATYMSYTPLHEAAHGNIHGRHKHLQWLNDACGYLCGSIIMVPYSTHTVEHFTHHRFTNHPDKDPDYVVKEMGSNPVAFVVTGFQFLWVQTTFLFRGHWAKSSSKERAVFIAEVTTALGWRAALLVLLPPAVGVTLIVLGYLAGAFFTAYWFAHRPHHPHEETARYRNTNSMIMPAWMKPLEWFWLGQNLHSIHHAFPRVPFYKYHQLYREIEPILIAHGNPVIGIFDRQAMETKGA